MSVTTLRRSRGTLAALIALVVVAGFLAGSTETAVGAKTRDDRRAPNVTFSLDSIVGQWRMYPIVTAPGAPGAVKVGMYALGKLPAKVWVRAWVKCYSAAHKPVYWQGSARRYIVPPHPRPPDITPTRIVLLRTRTPAACAKSRDGQIVNHDVEFNVDLQRTRRRASTFGGTVGLSLLGWKFTKGNIRHNLNLRQRIARKSKRQDYAAHHTLPQKFRTYYKRRGIDIDDPAYLRWWCSVPKVKGNHGSKAREYNLRWERWIKDHPRATRAEILAFRATVQAGYRYACPGERLPAAPKPYWRVAR